MARFLFILLAGLVSACTTMVLTPEALPVSTVSQCSAPVGVSVQYNNLFIATGKTRHTGTQLQMISQLRHNNSYQFVFRTLRYNAPAGGSVAPCLVVVMPQEWQEAFVINEATGEQWRVTP